MSIKATVSNKPCCKKELPFPKLMKYFKSPLVVLFTGATTGTVVVAGSDWKMGATSKTWANSNFEDFTGSVCLENAKE